MQKKGMSRLQNYLSSEFLASGLSAEFNDFVTKITQSKSKTEEASLATEELSKLGSKMGSPDVSSTRMKDYLIRLIHCFMLGYNVDFSVIYAIMASQSGDTAMDRRVGYLACTLFLEEDHELGIMLVNTLQRDLKSQNYLDKCAALNAICYLEHPEMSDNVLDLVIQAMSFPKQDVRKKVVMALYFLYEKMYVSLERIEPTLRQALEDKDSSVVFASLTVWKMILVDHASQYQDLLPTFHRIHRQIMEKRIHKSFTYHGVPAPWAQMECLQIYKLYYESNVGSPQDLYSIVVDCIQSVKKKVDAAFGNYQNQIIQVLDLSTHATLKAILLECVKLLASMDPILLGSLSTPEENPFQLLVSFLESSNHNLKYVGLIGMACVDESFWKMNWLDGTLLAECIKTCSEDNVIIAQAIENLEYIVDQDILHNVAPDMTVALSQSYNSKQNSSIIAYWLCNRIFEYYEEPDAWCVETVMTILSEARRNLDDDYIEKKCNLLKSALKEEVEGNSLRDTAVDNAYKLLKKCDSAERYSPVFVQLLFWILGESGYLSTEYTDLDIMKQLGRWIQLVQDDYLQVFGLQAIKRCIMRSKSWISGLDRLLKEYRKSPVPEKQEIARELLLILDDASFEKELSQDTDIATISPNLELSANPNRPKNISKYMSSSSAFIESPVVGSGIRHSKTSSLASSHDGSLHASQQYRNHNTRAPNGTSSIVSNDSSHKSNAAETNLMSSLIDLELQDEEEGENETIMVTTTQGFGHLWVQFSVEEKRKFECSVSQTEKLAKRLSKAWNIRVIQVIGQEFIAVSDRYDILVHIAMLPNSQFELTLRARSERDKILGFLVGQRLG